MTARWKRSCPTSVFSRAPAHDFRTNPAPTEPPSAPPPRSGMDRFIDTIEWVAAFFVGIVAANIFIAVLLRNLFSVAIPDTFDIGRLLLGILIFWGIAATSYRGGHITVDLVWANVAPRWQRAIDVFATLVLLFVVSVQTYTLFDKVRGTYYDHVLTFDLRLPTWPFFAVAWVGDVSAVLLIAIRTWRLVFQPEKLAGEGDNRAGQGGGVRPHGHRCRRHPGLRRAVRADAAARAGGHGDGAGGCVGLRLPGRRRPGAEGRRPHLHAHGDRLHLRRHPDVPADGRLRHQLRHEPGAVPRRQHLRRPPPRRARHCHHRRLRRLRRHLGIVGGDGRHLLHRRLPGDAPL